MKVSRKVLLTCVALLSFCVAYAQDAAWNAQLSDANVMEAIQSQIDAGREEQQQNLEANKIGLDDRQAPRREGGKYYGAIYVNQDALSSFYWAAGHHSLNAAKRAGAKACGGDCKLLAVVNDACVMFAEPKGNEGVENIVSGIDKDPLQAMSVAKERCQVTHGKACNVISRSMDAERSAFCVGADYGITGQ